MVSEVTQLEPRLKEILYRCLEQIRATKAALYLTSNGSQYEVVTHYGFSDTLRRTLNANDVVIDRLVMRRAAFFVNGLTVEPRFSDLLFSTKTERILVAPIYSRGKLIGLIDLRDKAGRQDFEQSDLDEAKKITDQFVDIFSRRGVLGVEPATSEPDEAGTLEVSPHLTRLLDSARVAVARDVVRSRPMSVTISEGDLTGIQEVLPAILVLPGATVAAFSAFGHSGNIQLIAVRSTMSEATMEQFQSKLATWMKSRGGDIDPGTRQQIFHPFGTSLPEVTPAQLATILSAPVSTSGMKGLVLTVAFESAPDAATRKNLERFLAVIQYTVEHSGAGAALRTARQKAAEKLLEPDFQKYPELVEHSKKVSLLSDQLAHHLGLSAGECDTVRIAALIHDVGMRLLDYARLYRKRDISGEELRLLREHSVVGAALVEPVFGSEMAMIVLSHHERADGKGYPNGIAGEAIPLGARILQICDAFDAMTSPHSYQDPMNEEAALSRVLRMGGAEFDHALAVKFKDMIGH